MTELILIRHGETDWNRELRFQGQVDVPLNATGMEQARRVAERLAAEQWVVDHLVCSDLIRTQHVEHGGARHGDEPEQPQGAGVLPGLPAPVC